MTEKEKLGAKGAPRRTCSWPIGRNQAGGGHAPGLQGGIRPEELSGSGASVTLSLNSGERDKDRSDPVKNKGWGGTG